MNEYEKKLIANVEEHGWQCSHIFDPEEKSPNFSYSIGFMKTLGCAEFIVFGLTNELMNAMLWQIFRDVQNGVEPQDGKVWSNLLDGFDCIIKKVHPRSVEMNYLNSAKWYWNQYLGQPTPIESYQIVWPGAHSGLFPWDDDCPQEIIDRQPPLYSEDLPDY